MRTEDGHIIQQCLDGDSAAYGFILEKYRKAVYALAYSRINNFHDAQDITQEVFIKAYKNLRILRRWDNFMGWLYRMTVNQCKDWIRANSRRPDGEFTEDQEPYVVDQPSLDSYHEDTLYESVREALDSLPEIYRDVTTLRYFSGMTVQEMAHFLGVSPGTIDRRLREARSRLKEEMMAMMQETYEQHQLPANFTFRILEIVKRIRIQTMPKSAGLPWGLSLAAGIAFVVMALGSQLSIIYEKPLVEIDVPKISEVSVDVFSGPQASTTAGQGDADGKGLDPRSSQKAALLAPVRGGGTWTQKADMPTKRTGAEAAVVDGKIYVFGGWMNTAPYTATRAIEEYDPATDTWTKKTDMPTERLANICAVNEVIYAIGGYIPGSGPSSAVEAYDPATEKWTKKASMPTPRTGGSYRELDGKIYAIGGLYFNKVLSTVEVYDPVTDKWTRKADMPTAKNCGGCVIDGKIYMFGGNTTWERGGLIPTVEVYDPAKDTWSQVSDMPWTKGGGSVSLVNGKVYVVGGVNTDMIDLFNAGEMGEDEIVKQFSIVDVYDPAMDTWTTATNMPMPSIGHEAVVVDGKIYIIGGMTGPNDTLLSDVYEFDPGLSHSAPGVRPDGSVPKHWEKVKSGK